MLAPYAFQDFCLQWSSCVVVFKKYLFVWFKSFIGSRVSYEWVLATNPISHVKSRVCFRVLSQNRKGEIVRLNLFNYLLALFCAKFACNLAIRYPIFRWELCKGSVWESVKKYQKCAIQRSLTTSKSPEWHTCEACKRSWRFMLAVALQEKTSSLARQFARDSF